MERILINPLSAIAQCTAVENLEAFFLNITDCFDYLLPALDSGRTTLFHDPLLEGRPLMGEENVIASISRLGGKRGPDLRKKWYLYTKNRSRKVPADHRNVSLISQSVGTNDSIFGELHKTFLVEEYALLSLGGHPILESDVVTICSPPMANTDRRNAWHVGSVVLLFPQYEASPKHRAEPYFDKERGEQVAPMQLTPSEAQSLLLQSVRHDGDFWGFHRPRRSFFRFKLTGGNVYHGFEAQLGEVPREVSKQLG